MPDPRDEYVFDTGRRRTRDDGVSMRGEMRGSGMSTMNGAVGSGDGSIQSGVVTDAGGFMDAFEGARDGDVSSPRDEKTKKQSDGSLGSEFGPARFGSEADDWEL